ncbi:SDR family oxidoreductase [Deinococcus sp. HMF7604]|uniref:SDR family oxidoreductase n=1 Tax=Deinococcus betulae TaxID=2873312 RepID=UPI001CCE028A|nr:SDR family oxidoreductase [Deinococcus betulae]MBZ9749543.1 SDR family oxidoreductase [Deinococcus betulae]
MIVVTGATGQLGRLIVEQLLTRVSPNQIGVSVRNPEKAGDLAALGVRVRPGDFAQPDTLARAFEGAEQVLLVSSNARTYGGNPLVQHRNAIEAARAAGVTRIVYTSQMAAGAASAFPPARDHAATEEMLQHSGLAWTALRNGFYTESLPMFMGNALETGLLDTPQDGPVAWTTHHDLAGGAAAILAQPGQYEGPTPPLTAAQAVDFTELASIASDVLGRPVQHTVFPDEELGRRLEARGLSAAAAPLILGMYQAGRAGEFAGANPALEQLLERPTTDIRTFLQDHLSQ